MPDQTNDNVTHNHALALAHRLREIVAETKADIDRMPIFVRPMAKRGFAKRTGYSFDDWERLARELITRLQSDSTGYELTISRLGALLDNYRTAPERAGKMMRGAALQTLRERSKARENVVGRLIDALQALGQ